jgi:hypothetical protein
MNDSELARPISNWGFYNAVPVPKQKSSISLTLSCLVLKDLMNRRLNYPTMCIRNGDNSEANSDVNDYSTSGHRVESDETVGDEITATGAW